MVSDPGRKKKDGKGSLSRKVKTVKVGLRPTRTPKKRKRDVRTFRHRKQGEGYNTRLKRGGSKEGENSYQDGCTKTWNTSAQSAQLTQKEPKIREKYREDQ